MHRSANEKEIKSAYKKLSKKWHPDKHKGDIAVTTKFQEINEANSGNYKTHLLKIKYYIPYVSVNVQL